MRSTNIEGLLHISSDVIDAECQDALTNLTFAKLNGFYVTSTTRGWFIESHFHTGWQFNLPKIVHPLFEYIKKYYDVLGVKFALISSNGTRPADYP